MSYEAWNKKLAKCSELFKAGQPVWWTREQFYKDKFKDVAPKWHVFKDRTKTERGQHQWKAICGYSYGFWETLLEVPRLKLGKALPKKAERCTKCTAALAKEQS